MCCQLDVAIRNVVGQRLIGWYRALVFSSGSIVATTGFTIYGLIDSYTKDHLKDSITTTLMNANTSYLIDQNSITIVRQFLGNSLLDIAALSKRNTVHYEQLTRV